MPSSVREMLAEANAAVPRLNPAEVRDMSRNGHVLIVDVRDAPEAARRQVSESATRYRAEVHPILSPAERGDNFVVPALTAWVQDEFVFAERSGLLAGPDEAGAVATRLGGGSWLPVAVGSGVLTDIVRYAAHGAGRDFVSVPTAASMDGYASSVAAMQVDGVKVTYPARAPVAIYADPRVAAAAPAELTRAGLGDLLAKATAGVDWLAAHLLYGESYDSRVVELVSGPLRFAALSADRVVAGEPAAVAELLEGLIGSGTAMALAGSSRPASGCEHHASHFWDLLAAHGRRPHESHGLQVGYATRFAMRLQRFAFGGRVVTLRAPARPADQLGPNARAWLGDPVAPDIVDAVAAKRRFVAHAGAGWPASQGEWVQLRGRIAPAMALFDDVEAGLDAAGIPRGPGWLGLDRDTLRAGDSEALQATVLDMRQRRCRVPEHHGEPPTHDLAHRGLRRSSTGRDRLHFTGRSVGESDAGGVREATAGWEDHPGRYHRHRDDATDPVGGHLIEPDHQPHLRPIENGCPDGPSTRLIRGPQECRTRAAPGPLCHRCPKDALPATAFLLRCLGRSPAYVRPEPCPSFSDRRCSPP